MKTPLLALLLLLASSVQGAVVIKAFTFTATTGENIEIAWEAGPFCLSQMPVQYPAEEGCQWEWELVDLPLNRTVATGKTFEPEAFVKLPRTGLYGFKVRACMQPKCSGWAFSVSSSDGIIDGVDSGWTLYGYPAPPGDIGFE